MVAPLGGGGVAGGGGGVGVGGVGGGGGGRVGVGTSGYFNRGDSGGRVCSCRPGRTMGKLLTPY